MRDWLIGLSGGMIGVTIHVMARHSDWSWREVAFWASGAVANIALANIIAKR